MMTLRWSLRLRVTSELLRGSVLAVTLGMTAPCFGQVGPGQAGAGPASQAGAVSPSSESDEDAARRLYESAIQHYNVAAYEKAIAEFREAYYLTNAPELLYNIAQSYRLRGPGHCASALQFYKNYLRLQPKTPKRASVEAALRDMETCARTEPSIAPEPDVVPPATPPPAAPASDASPAPATPSGTATSATSPWPFVVSGTGLGLSLLGGGLLLWSRLRFDALSDEGCAPSCNPARTETPRALQTTGGVVLGVGGALLVAGVVTWLIAPRDKATTTALRVLTTGAIAF